MLSATKDPVKVRAGTIGARTRWGEPGTRSVSLRDLDPATRRLVIAMVDAAKAAKAAEHQGPGATDTAGKK